jgi:hypothetical protein
VSGDGLDGPATTITEAASVATFAVPLHAAFALTTLSGGLMPPPAAGPEP